MVRARRILALALGLAGAGACDRILNLPERAYGPDAEAPGTGGSSAGRGSGGGGSTHAPIDTAQYSFESDPQRWEACGKMAAGVTVSSSKVYAGQRSLAVNFQANFGGLQCQGARDPETMHLVSVRSPPISPGKIVTFHVWIPAMSAIASVQPYILTEDGRWEGDYRLTSTLAGFAWNEFKVRYPSDAAPLEQMGVEFVINASSSWSGTCYIDTVSW